MIAKRYLVLAASLTLLTLAAAQDPGKSPGPIQKIEAPPTQTEIVVIRLRYADASQISGLLAEVNPPPPGVTIGGRRSSVAVAVDQRNNSIIVSAAPAKIAEIKELVAKLDVESRRIPPAGCN